VPAKADPDEQAAFLKDELRPRLDKAERARGTVLFVDAAHFVYGPFLAYVWCLVRLFVPGPSGRKRYNVLAALNAVTHDVIRVTSHGYVNAGSVCELLAKVAAAGLPGEVTLVMDNARYQRCALVQEEARRLGVGLLFLPGYSPNLNLIERLWKFVKKEVLGARSLPTYEAFTSAIDGCLDQLPTKHKAQMDTLLTLDFQLFDDVPMLPA
jgi:transposase